MRGKSGSSSQSSQPPLTNTIDLHTFLRTRRSIRRFKPDPIPDSVIREILYTATLAPSAHNRQPWRFVVLTEKSSIQRFAEMMAIEFQHVLKQDHLPPEEIQKRLVRSQERISGAPVVIVACVDMTEMEKYPDERRKKAEYLIATQSVANAGMQLLLAAHAEGLGAVWICSPLFAQSAVQEALKIEAIWEPQAMFLIGTPEDIPTVRERKPIDKISIFIDKKGT